MLTDLFSGSVINFIFWAVALIICVDIHEFAHALIAEHLGDPTPRINGRLTLNPIAHLDPIGSLALLIFHIGWGKPVPIDPFNLKDPRRDSALISIAGPASNMILAGVLALLLRLPIMATLPLLATFLITVIIISVGLSIFNLIPVPPLDGSKVFFGFLSPAVAGEWEEALNQYGILLLLLIIFPLFGGASLLDIVILPIIRFILAILLPQTLFTPLI